MRGHFYVYFLVPRPSSPQFGEFIVFNQYKFTGQMASNIIDYYTL